MEVKEILENIIKHNSYKSYRELYFMYYDHFYRIAYHYLNSEELAQEIVIDVFANIWKNRNKLIIPDDFEKYSFILLKNASLNYLEKEKKYNNTSKIDDESLLVYDNENPEDNLINEELFEVYEKTLNELPERCREVYVKVKEEKRSYAEVSEELKISKKTVDAHIQRAIKELKGKLIKYLKTSV